MALNKIADQELINYKIAAVGLLIIVMLPVELRLVGLKNRNDFIGFCLSDKVLRFG